MARRILCGVPAAGLALGVLGVVAALVPYYGVYAAVPLGLAAALLGGLARRRAHERGQPAGLSTAALSLGVVALCLGFGVRLATELLLARARHP